MPTLNRERIRLTVAERRYVQQALKNLERNKQELREHEEALIWATGSEKVGSRSGVSDSTYDRALILYGDERRHLLITSIKAVESVLAELPPDKKKAISLRYLIRPRVLSDEGIAIEVGCGRKTLFRWDNEVLTEIAMRMGLV